MSSATVCSLAMCSPPGLESGVTWPIGVLDGPVASRQVTAEVRAFIVDGIEAAVDVDQATSMLSTVTTVGVAAQVVGRTLPDYAQVVVPVGPGRPPAPCWSPARERSPQRAAGERWPARSR